MLFQLYGNDAEDLLYIITRPYKNLFFPHLLINNMARIILLFSIFILGFNFQNSNFKRTKKHSKKMNQAKAFYQAAQTGDKSNLTQKYKLALKEFGLIHLLTPSGIHLSAILGIFLFFLPKKYHIGIFSFTLLIFVTTTGLYSLKRVLYFQIITFFLKGKFKNQIGFILTFILDAFLGGYLASPLSFSYSFLFWGVIIFSKKSFINVSINLFLAQLISIYFGHGSINLFAIIINPLFTSLYSFLFPIFSLNYWILDSFGFTKLIIDFHHYFLNILHFLKQNLSIFLLTSHPLILLLPLISFRSKKGIVSVLCFFCLNLNQSNLYSKDINFFYTIPEKSELIITKKNKLNFFDIKCNRYFMGSYWRYSCKERSSKYGGPIF